MSRTDKTRPYWVKVNDHGVEHHDHSHLGEEVWRKRAVKDSNGVFVMEEATFYRQAQDVLEKEDRTSYFYKVYRTYYSEDGKRRYYLRQGEIASERPTNKVIAEAEAAVAAGDPRCLIRAGTYMRNVMEEYLAYTIADHCTIDEKRNTTGWRWSRSQPCYMEADWRGADRNQFRCSCRMCSGRDPHFERARRRNKRDQLRQATKLANSGVEDWHEDWNDLRVTTPLRYNVEWC